VQKLMFTRMAPIIQCKSYMCQVRIFVISSDPKPQQVAKITT
jgi:hypothetical protein